MLFWATSGIDPRVGSSEGEQMKPCAWWRKKGETLERMIEGEDRVPGREDRRQGRGKMGLGCAKLCCRTCTGSIPVRG